MVGVDYIVVDFNGEVEWAELEDESYAVDPLYVEEFLATIG